MDYNKFFGKYKMLFKTKKALEYFLNEYGDKDLWVEIMKYYGPKTGKPIGKINWVDLADRVHSEYTRLRECDSGGICTCVTCGKKGPRQAMQEGHYRTRGHRLTRYDDRNTHVQCYTCNCTLSGNYRNYHIWMLKQYGPEVEDWLWCNNQIADYKQDRYEKHIRERYIFNSGKKLKVELIGNGS